MVNLAGIDRKNKQLNSREFAKILRKNGFEFDGYGRGSHIHYRRGNDLVVLSANSCNRMWSRRMIKEFNLEF